MGKKELRVPKFMNMPWLTFEYVKKNAWHPVCDEWLKDVRYYTDSEFGRCVPIKSRSEFRPGDVIIFNEYDERETNSEFYSDRFLKIDNEDIENYLKGGRDLLPVGVVVHPPQ